MRPLSSYFKDKTIRELISFGKENPAGISDYYVILIRKLTGLSYSAYTEISLQELTSQFGPILNAKFSPPTRKSGELSLHEIQEAVKNSNNMEEGAYYLGLSSAALRLRLNNITIPDGKNTGHFNNLKAAFSNQFNNILDTNPPEKQSAFLVLISLTPLKIYNAYKQQNSNVTETARVLGVTKEELESRLRCFVLNDKLLTLECLKEHFEKEASVAAAAAGDLDRGAKLNVSTHAEKLSPSSDDTKEIKTGQQAYQFLSELLSIELDTSQDASTVSPDASSCPGKYQQTLFTTVRQKRRDDDDDHPSNHRTAPGKK